MGYQREVDYDEVRRLAALGCSHDEIGARFNLSRRTVCRRLQDDEEFALAYEQGRAQLCEEVSTMLLDAARNGSVDAMKFALERRCGWHKQSKQEIELAGKADGPSINITLTTAAPAENLLN